jgi:AcrR family transcriptional regulator
LAPELVSADQRARLHAAMVQLVAESGYLSTTVEAVLSRAGVSRRTFYEHYENKQDCFLGACDEVLAHWMTQGTLAYQATLAGAGGQSLEARLRAGLSSLFGLVESDPLGARTIFLETLNCGSAGLRRLETAIDELERIVRGAFRGRGGKPELPCAMATVIVGGILEIVTVRLRHGRTDELPALVEPLVAWTLSYRSAAAGLALDRARAVIYEVQATEMTGGEGGGEEDHVRGALWRDGSARPVALPDARARIMDAAAEIASERGYAALSINEIDRVAGVSHHTFRKHFASKDEAFTAAYRQGSRDTIAYCLAAYAAQTTWPACVHAGLAAEVRFLGERPVLARIGFLEVYASGPEALELRESELHTFTAALAPGYEQSTDPPHPVVSEAIAGGIYQLMRECVLHDGPEQLPLLAPEATYAALAPFLGAKAAAATAATPIAA